MDNCGIHACDFRCSIHSTQFRNSCLEDSVMKFETKCKYSGRIKYLLQHFKREHKLPDYRVENFEVLLKATIDVFEYQNITHDEFWIRYLKWPQVEKELFEKSKNLNGFYQSWNEKAADMNLCANTINQMIYPENYNVIAYFFNRKGYYIDYGCGSATLSLGIYLKNRLKGKLKLLDVPNDIQKYIDYRIEKYYLSNDVSFDSVFSFHQKNMADGIMCIDVLEHLNDPSEILIEKISPMLKIGGLLLLRAPWRGQLTHLDTAPDDFYQNGGRKYLDENYKEVYRFGVNDISAVYKKIK